MVGLTSGKPVNVQALLGSSPPWALSFSPSHLRTEMLQVKAKRGMTTVRVYCQPLQQQGQTQQQGEEQDENVGIMCEPCNGQGWLLCDFCKGQKTNVKADNNRIYRRCPSCRAVGYLLCSNCKVFKCVTFPDYSDEEVETNAAMKKELSSHLSELRIEGTSISAVDFSDPCSVCGNKKRRCLQPPTSFRKKVLIVEDDTDAQTHHNSDIDDDDERDADFPTTPGKTTETKEEEKNGNGECCSLCQRCSRDGLSRSSSLVTEEKGGSFLAGESSSFLERTSSVVTEDKGRNFAGGGRSPFLGRKNSIVTDDEKSKSISDGGASGSLLRMSRTSSVVTTEEKGGTFASRDGGSSPFNSRTKNSLPVSPQLGRNGSVHSSISPLLTMSSGNLSSILSPEIRRMSSTGPTGHLLSPVVVTDKKSKVHFSYDASPSAAAAAATVAETKKEIVQRTPKSGGRSAEKVKVSLKCQCGVRHKIIF